MGRAARPVHARPVILIMFLCWAVQALGRAVARVGRGLRPRRLRLVTEDVTAEDPSTETTAA